MPNLENETDSQHEGGKRCYRPPLALRYCTLGFTLFWITIGILTVPLLFNVGSTIQYQEVNVPALLIASTLFGCLGIWCVLECYKWKLTLSNEEIVFESSFNARSMRFDEITSAFWDIRCRCLYLRSDEKKLNLYFWVMTRKQRKEIVHFLQNKIDKSIQFGRSDFGKSGSSNPKPDKEQ